VNSLLITGGAGFIGSNLVRYILRETSYNVVVVDKLTYAANHHAVGELSTLPRVTLLLEDIADEFAMSKVFQEHRPSAVLHLAAESHVDRSIDGPRAFVQTNVVGTFTLLEAARRFVQTLDHHAREAFRFLNVSTDEVYGSLGDDGYFRETTPYAPNSPYAATKAAADHLVRAYFETYRLQTLITNCSNNYGPFQHPEKLIPLTILNALQARPLPIYGDGQNVRDWLHVEDHCAAILSVLDRGRPGQSYNVGASNEQSNLTLIDLICDTLETIHPASTNPAMQAARLSCYRDLKQFVPDRPGHDRRYAIAAEKIRQELAWAPRYTFASGLRATVQWYVDNLRSFEADRVGYDRHRLGLAEMKA
jgi:dTDP-glucose 4,6-dehydratase